MNKYELNDSDENLKLTIENDALGRNSKLIILGKLLNNLNNNSIISIDGKWGSGKTFFIKQFDYLIRKFNLFDDRILSEKNKEIFSRLKNNNLVVYYNAWENDSHDNALESLIYNILNEYPKQKKQLIDFNEFKKLIKPFCRDVVHSLSNGMFDLNNIEKMNSFEDLAKNIFTIEEKKKAFNKLIDEILIDKQRLILVIDELDRCKPTFAVEMLETIKHFYSNSKMTIIITTNNLELSNTIRKVYGQDFDGYGYLNKFYDCVINLEVKNIKDYLQKQLNFCTKTYIYHDFSNLVMEYYNFSLRDCNRYMTFYDMLKNYIEEECNFNKEFHYIFSCIILPLIVSAKIKNLENYNQMVSNKGEKIIEDFINIKIIDTKYERWLKEILKYEKDNKEWINEILQVYYSIFDTNNNDSTFFDVVSLLGSKLMIEEKE